MTIKNTLGYQVITTSRLLLPFVTFCILLVPHMASVLWYCEKVSHFIMAGEQSKSFGDRVNVN